MIARFFVRKYSRPTTCPTFAAKADAEWLEEMYADLYAEQEQALYSLGHLHESGLAAKALEAERRRLMAEVTRLAKALGEDAPASMTDSLLDEMDAKLARGEQVDLSTLLPKGYRAPRR